MSNAVYNGTLFNETLNAVDLVTGKVDSLAGDLDALWVLIAGCLVFFMQLGFGMLESGTVRSKNVNNILFKNLMDASVGAMVWFVIGYAFAYGDGEDNGFIGSANFALTDEDFGGWFFQWTFAATAATIVSGSVAERCTIDAYFLYAIFITGFIYPVVVHWVWDGEGWLSAFNAEADIQAMDFAGSGVVHMVGGFSGLMGAWIIGPRIQSNPDSKTIKSHNVPQQVMGTLILWFGWYGFNCGSTLAVFGAMELATRVACTTTLAAAAGVVSSCVVGRFLTKGHWDLTLGCNGALSGLVSITAGCAVVSPGSAIAIGTIGGLLYIVFSYLVGEVMKIDDPLDASSVHGFCGFWGVVAVALFAKESAVLGAYGEGIADLSRGTWLKNQIVEALMVMVWTCFTSGILFMVIKATVGLRVSNDVELTGLDYSKHGGEAYNFSGSTRKMEAELAPKRKGAQNSSEDV